MMALLQVTWWRQRIRVAADLSVVRLQMLECANETVTAHLPGGTVAGHRRHLPSLGVFNDETFSVGCRALDEVAKAMCIG